MFTSRSIALTASLCAACALAEELPQLGTPASEKEIAAIDITVLPNGDGLPSGSGNVAAGAYVYRTHCMGCHGSEGIEGINDVLVGGRGTLTTATPIKTIGSYWPYATTLFDYIRRAMPYFSPGTLTNDEVYAVTAYLLHLNGIIRKDARIDATTLPKIKMPNRDNFRWDYPLHDLE